MNEEGYFQRILIIKANDELKKTRVNLDSSFEKQKDLSPLH